MVETLKLTGQRYPLAGCRPLSFSKEMNRHRTIPIIIALLALSVSSCDAQFRAKEVARVETTVPVFEDVKILDAKRFLNDLKLSPFWKVERDRRGTLIAKASVPVHEPYDSKIGPNSSARVAVRLSDDQDVFLVIYEQGSDLKRTTTWKMLPGIVNELKSVASLPNSIG